MTWRRYAGYTRYAPRVGRHADVAQRQSNGFVNRRLSVRIRPSAPREILSISAFADRKGRFVCRAVEWRERAIKPERTPGCSSQGGCLFLGFPLGEVSAGPGDGWGETIYEGGVYTGKTTLVYWYVHPDRHRDTARPRLKLCEVAGEVEYSVTAAHRLACHEDVTIRDVPTGRDIPTATRR